jgi:hypothetical protein
VRQFIQDHLAPILYAESQGALPGDPQSLPKKKRREAEDDDESPVKELAGRMIMLVEVSIRHFKNNGWWKELMNRLARPDGQSPWVDISEDDVIVRCLVRSNIVLMHPNDGSKIRLVEFQKEVESGEMEED